MTDQQTGLANEENSRNSVLRIFLTVLCACLFLLPTAEAELEYLGSVGGAVVDIAVYKDPNGSGQTYAYVAQGTAIHVMDTSDSQNPVLVRRIQPTTDVIRGLAIVDHVLIFANNRSGVYLYSLEDPTNPCLLSIVQRTAHDVFACGWAMIVADYTHGAGVSSSTIYRHILYDISDPAMPVKLGDRSHYAWEMRPSPSCFFAEHTPDRMQSHFYWYEPQCPIFKDTINYSTEKPFNDLLYSNIYLTKCYALGLFTYKERGYVTLSTALEVYDFSAAASPANVASVTVSGVVAGAIQNDERAYIPTNEGLTVLSLADPDCPEIIESISLPFRTIRVVDDVAYGVGSEGFAMAELHGPYAGKTVQTDFEIGCVQQVLLHNSTLLIREEERISFLNFTSPSEYELVGQFDTGVCSDNLQIDGDTLLIPKEDTYYLADISDVANPSIYGNVPAYDSYLSPVLTNGLLFLCDGNWEVRWHVFSLLDPPNIVEISDFKINSYEAFTKSGIILYTMTGSGAVKIDMHNIGQPDNVQYVGEFAPAPGASCRDPGPVLSVSERNLFIICNANTQSILFICDISNPASPEKISETIIPGTYSQILPQGRFLWMLESDFDDMTYWPSPTRNLHLIDISDPMNPMQIDGLSFGSEVEPAGVLYKDLLFLPGAEGGLHMIRNTEYHGESIDNWEDF
ncbi:MAG TPA: hypothetical protein PLY86_14060 [bacterium]|nr:hypothetical protein [bacterium]